MATIGSKSVTKSGSKKTEYKPYEYKDSPYTQYFDQMKGYYENAYQTQLMQQQMARNEGIAGINRTSDESLRQAYISKEKNLQGLPQQMVANGLSGGASETALLGLNTSYGNNRNGIEKSRISGHGEVNNAYSQATSQLTANHYNTLGQLNNQMGLQQTEWEQRESDKKTAYEQRIEEQIQQDKIYGDEQAYREEQNLKQEEENAYIRNQQAKEEAWNFGNQYGDYSDMANFGWSKSKINKATKTWNESKGKTTSAKSGGSSISKLSGSGGSKTEYSSSTSDDVNYDKTLKEDKLVDHIKTATDNVWATAKDGINFSWDSVVSQMAYLRKSGVSESDIKEFEQYFKGARQQSKAL